MEKRTLLGLFAHPDDESFGPGGTLARYAAEGADVHVIIATDGDAGSVEESHKRQDGRSLAQERGEELSNAAVALGVTSIWNLPYRDSGMRGSADNQHPRALIQQPLETLTAELVDYIRRLRPQVILTHDPFGGYGHPDHIRCCEAMTAAFYMAGQSDPARNGSGLPAYTPQKLYYTAFDKRLLKVVVKIMQLTGKDPSKIGRNQDIDLVEISRWETPVHARVNVADYAAQKDAASQAHASQYGGGPAFLRMMPGFLRRRLASHDTFTRAYPAPTSRTESDLFAQVQLNRPATFQG
ncbi:MAG: PIG-L family deacetylase [Caldilineaceae bacterium]